MLVDEGLQQGTQGLHDLWITVQLVGAVLLDPAYAVLLDVTRNYAGKGPAQVGGQQMRGRVAPQRQGRHVLVGRVEGMLEVLIDPQQPVEVEGVVALTTEALDLGQSQIGRASCRERV